MLEEKALEEEEEEVEDEEEDDDEEEDGAAEEDGYVVEEKEENEEEEGDGDGVWLDAGRSRTLSRAVPQDDAPNTKDTKSSPQLSVASHTILS